MGNDTTGGTGGVEPIPNVTRPNTPSAPTPTAAEVQQTDQQYHLRHYSDGQTWLTNLFRSMFGGNHDPNSVDMLDPATVQSLRNGLATRSAPGAPSVNYAAMSHQQLYDAVTKDVDPGQIGDVAASWDKYSKSMIEASQGSASQALAASELAWTGTTSEQARAAVADMANQMGQAGQAAQVSAQLYKQQAAASQTAKNSIPEPPAHPFNAAAAQQQLMTTTDPIQMVNLVNQEHAQFAAQQAAKQKAVQVVSDYDRTVSQTSRNQPAFAPAPQVAKSGGAPSTQPSGSVGNPGGGHGGVAAPQLRGSSGGWGGSGSGGHGGSQGGGGGGFVPPPVTTQPSTNGPSGQTGAAGYTPPVSSGPSSNPGGWSGGNPGGVGNQPPSWDNPGPGMPGGGGFFSPGDGAPYGGGAAGYPSGGSGGFGPTGSGGSGSDGGLSGGSKVPGGNGSGSGGSGNQSRSGVGAGAEAGEEGGGYRAGAPTSRGGSAGAGGVGGTRGARGGEDSEHKRASYLLENDPDSIFGTDEKTAPPVIGG